MWEYGLAFQRLLHGNGSLFGLYIRASADRRGPAVEEDLRVIRLIQNLVGHTGRPACCRSQPTHSWHSGDTLLTMRVTFFAAWQLLGG
jgi:hypothetical protein